MRRFRCSTQLSLVAAINMNESPCESIDTCIYEIDSDDRIVFCNAEWDAFALANGGDDTVFRNIKGKVLWNFVADASSKDLYRRLVVQVRNGRTVKFSLRCDSPETFRMLEMKIYKTEADRVRFATQVKVLEPRSGETINASDEGEPLLICSWCGRVNIDDHIWHDVEVAIAQMRIFERSHPPAISHGICSDCYLSMAELLATVD